MLLFNIITLNTAVYKLTYWHTYFLTINCDVRGKKLQLCKCWLLGPKQQVTALV